MKIGMFDVNKVNTIIFDCDGVILNSNQLKTKAYYKATFPSYGHELASSLTTYLAKNTGKPRDHFFDYFLRNIVPSDISGPGLKELVSEVTKEIYKGLMECEVSPCLFELREKTPDTKWFLVSGGVEKELRDVFRNRSLFDLFDGGIYGGPMTKDEILISLINKNHIKFPALSIGDSQYDYEVASRVKLDFLFVSGWSEFKDWQNYCNSNKILSINSLCNIL
jgi:phosphoglycolate phosphatase-like HAD superfamily hydrolase